MPAPPLRWLSLGHLRGDRGAGFLHADLVASEAASLTADTLLDRLPADTLLPAHDPPLEPRDEAVFLLRIAAEVEHALLVQYLYAAYSLVDADPLPPGDLPDPELHKLAAGWRETILGIAKEEMGHLVTVLNLLRLVGGPMVLSREDFPFRSAFYPFHFRLERLTLDSLAKYVVAEMPAAPNLDPASRRTWNAGRPGRPTACRSTTSADCTPGCCCCSAPDQGG